MKPQISIVVPLYNRAQFIARALDSCLAQTFRNFEIIVVDDGSTDDSADKVAAYSDPRIRLFRQSHNRGVGPARNRGADAAESEWLVFLDSDDEFVPTALEIIMGKIKHYGSAADGFLFRCRLDDGAISPTSMPATESKFSYHGYMEYINACADGLRECLVCRRRSTFAKLRFPDNYGLEDFYHLEFGKYFTQWSCCEILRLYHQDAGNQLVKRVGQFDRAHDLRFSLDRAQVLEDAIRQHGPSLRTHAPLLLEEFISRLLVLDLLCGKRIEAVKLLGAAFKWRHAKPSTFVVFCLGIIHPSMITFARWLRARRPFRARSGQTR